MTQLGMTVKYLQLSPTHVMKVSALDGSQLPKIQIDLYRHSVEQPPLVTWSIFDVWSHTKTDIPTSTCTLLSQIFIYAIEASISETMLETSLSQKPLCLETLISNTRSLLEEVVYPIFSNIQQNTRVRTDYGN